MDGYLTKPIWPEELFAALKAATGPKGNLVEAPLIVGA
jgi:hypothetical protein